MTAKTSRRPAAPTRSLDEILGIIDAIPEKMCGAPQPRFLHDLCLKCSRGGAVVEIGTCAGKSTIALAFARQVRGERPITTIDMVEHGEIEANLSRAGVREFVHRVVRRSNEVAASWSEPVELLWIDGDHSYKGVSDDIECWADKLMPGGFMAFHDFPSQGGKLLGPVGRAVYEKVLSRPDRWRVLADREAGSILVLERMQPGAQAEPGYAAGLLERARFFLAGLGRRAAAKLRRGR